MQEFQVRSLGWEDPLEKRIATHYSILTRRIPWTEESNAPQSMGSQRVGHNWVTKHACKLPLPISSVHFSCSVVSDSLRPHKLQHTRTPCSSQTAGVYPNPCPLSRWCHPKISSSIIPFSSWTQSFPASGSFQMSQLFRSGGQSIGVSASTVLPKTFLHANWKVLTFWHFPSLFNC